MLSGYYQDFPELDEESKAELEAVYSDGMKLRERILSVFDSEDGRAVAKFLIYDVCRVCKSSFSANPLAMARDCGKQEVGILLKSILES